MDSACGCSAAVVSPPFPFDASAPKLESASAPSGEETLALFYEICSTNSIIEWLYKKLEFVEYLFRCSYNSTLFSQTECVQLKLFG